MHPAPMRHWISHRLTPAGAILLFTLASAAQQAPSPDANAPEVTSHEGAITFSSQVNLVSVPGVVRDREGRALGNLKQDDFQLFDKGKLQVITRFEVEKSEGPTVETSAPAGSAGSKAKKKGARPGK